MKKKTWEIRFIHQNARIRSFFKHTLLQELELWEVKEDKYKVEGEVITTSDANVVDVATETFMKKPSAIKIEEVKET